MQKNWIVLLLMVSGVLLVGTVTSCITQSATAGSISVGISPVDTPIPVERNPEEDLAEDKKLQEGEKVAEVNFGPESAGMSIRIAGKEVKLSEDTYVEFYVATGICPIGETCKETPFFVLRRGEATIAFVARTGEMFVDPSRTPEQHHRDREAFKYIEGILKEKSEESK